MLGNVLLLFYPVCERPDVYKVEVTRTFVRFMVDFLCMFYPVCERPDGYKVGSDMCLFPLSSDNSVCVILIICILAYGMILYYNDIIML